MAGRETGTFVPPTETGFRPPVFSRKNEVLVFNGIPFTSRRIEVLTLSASGLSRQEIAEKLSLHIMTIDKHRGGIKDELGTDNIFSSIILSRQRT